jgi:glycosyltransferase involved in cell wall biosynthesis
MLKDFSNLKVAIITDSMFSFGGSDRLMISLFEIFPNSEIFTTVYNPKKYNITKKVNTSFLQHFGFIARYLSFLFPFSFELFDLSDFDFVISLSAGPAKNIIPGVYQPHLSIILTPPRHYWDGELNVRGRIIKRVLSVISKFMLTHLRIVDILSMKRIKSVISISKYIQKKVLRIYGVDSEVVYPGISKYWFEKPSKIEVEIVKKKYNLPETFLMITSRLFSYKNIDWAIRSAIENNIDLFIVGSGPDYNFLKSVARQSKYIHFLRNVSDEELKSMYSLSSCFLFPALEDFGYVSIEAMAQGTPVFCLNRGGSIETVLQGRTGEYFQDENELNNLISKKAWKGYNRTVIVNRAREFSQEKFLKKVLQKSIEVYEDERKKN